jgi:hypothetical protein
MKSRLFCAPDLPPTTYFRNGSVGPRPRQSPRSKAQCAVPEHELSSRQPSRHIRFGNPRRRARVQPCRALTRRPKDRRERRPLFWRYRKMVTAQRYKNLPPPVMPSADVWSRLAGEINEQHDRLASFRSAGKVVPRLERSAAHQSLSLPMVAVVISVRWQSASLACDLRAHTPADFGVWMSVKHSFHRQGNLGLTRLGYRPALPRCLSRIFAVHLDGSLVIDAATVDAPAVFFGVVRTRPLERRFR